MFIKVSKKKIKLNTLPIPPPKKKQDRRKKIKVLNP